MITVKDIEKSIACLPPKDLAELRAWFAAFDADQWDKQMEADITAGKLDQLASSALEEFGQGRCKEI